MTIRLFTENPSAFWSSFPELANAIELHLQASSKRASRVPLSEGYMTERERQFKLNALSETIEQYRASGKIEPDNARRALALAAAVGEHASPYKQTLLEIVERVLGLPLNFQNPEKLTFLKGKSEHHTFQLVRGLTLSLAWDGELIAISLDPSQWRLRAQMLSIVGIGRDQASDVAERHDDYLADAIQHG
jgi:hypothetical protein